MAISPQYILLPAKSGITLHHAPPIGFEVVADLGEPVDMAAYCPAPSAFLAGRATVETFAPILPVVGVMNRYPPSADLASAFPPVYQALVPANRALVQARLLPGRDWRPLVRGPGLAANGACDKVFVVLARSPNMGIVPLQTAFAAPAPVPIVP